MLPLPARAPAQVLLDKLGASVDAESADLGCNGTEPGGRRRLTCGVHLHGVGDGGVQAVGSAGSQTGSLRMVPLDSALTSVGTASPLPTPLVKPDTSGGVHFALVGNMWNTNYPFWYRWPRARRA